MFVLRVQKELDCYSDAYFDVVDPVLKRIKKSQTNKSMYVFSLINLN